MIAIPLKVYAVAGGLLLAGGAVGWYNHTQREIGATRVLLAQSHAQLDSLAKLARQVEVQFRTDTIRLRKLESHTDTLHDSVLVHLTDTVRVKEYIVAADSTIKVCRVTLADCALGWDTAKRQVTVLTDQVRILEHQRPSLLGNVLRAGLWFGGGYLTRTIQKP